MVAETHTRGPAKRLTDYEALTFDVYGTLIDWETGIVDGLKSLTERSERPLSRDEILEAHAVLEATQQRYTPAKPYRDILAVVYRRLGERWRVSTSWEECFDYGNSIRHWPAFPDSVDALRYLKQHYRLFVLSNVDQTSFAHSNEKLGVVFDGVFTAEDVGSYKPAERNFSYMLEMLAGMGIEAHRVLHTAESLFHDHAPANRAGLASCHIYRRHGQPGFGATLEPAETPSVNYRFNSMREFVDAHRTESTG